MCFFLYIVYQLLVGLSNATNQEASDPVSKGKNKDKDKDELKTKMLVQARCLATVVGVLPAPMRPPRRSRLVTDKQTGEKAAQQRQKCGLCQECGCARRPRVFLSF